MVSEYFGIVALRGVAGVGFLLGTFVGSLFAAMHRAIKVADLWFLIKARFVGGAG
ncbi:MFS transporter, partial [Pseudomonas aeruginosa]